MARGGTGASGTVDGLIDVAAVFVPAGCLRVKRVRDRLAMLVTNGPPDPALPGGRVLSLDDLSHRDRSLTNRESAVRSPVAPPSRADAPMSASAMCRAESSRTPRSAALARSASSPMRTMFSWASRATNASATSGLVRPYGLPRRTCAVSSRTRAGIPDGLLSLDDPGHQRGRLGIIIEQVAQQGTRIESDHASVSSSAASAASASDRRPASR